MALDLTKPRQACALRCRQRAVGRVARPFARRPLSGIVHRPISPVRMSR
jgi:hypothetical protein